MTQDKSLLERTSTDFGRPTQATQSGSPQAEAFKPVAGSAMLYLLPAAALSPALWGSLSTGMLAGWLLAQLVVVTGLLWLPARLMHAGQDEHSLDRFHTLAVVFLSLLWAALSMVVPASLTSLVALTCIGIALLQIPCSPGRTGLWLVCAAILHLPLILHAPVPPGLSGVILLSCCSLSLGLMLRVSLQRERELALARELLQISSSEQIAIARQEQQQLTREQRRLSVELRRALSDANHQKRALAALPDALVLCDHEGLISDINAAAEELLGLTANESRQRPINLVLKLIDEKRRERISDPVLACLRTGEAQHQTGSLRLVRRDGHERAVDIAATPMQAVAMDRGGCVLQLRDVTADRDRARRISWQACHDPLTHLINRTEFENRLQTLVNQTVQSGHQHVLCFLDLDKFKQVNDEAGHAAGDLLLKRIARLLKRFLRDTDTLARIGGDEFAILLYRCTPEKAIEITDTLRQRVCAYRFNWHGRSFRVGVSIGLMPIRGDERDIHALLKSADHACYEAKHGGRNQVVLSQDDPHERLSVMALEALRPPRDDADDEDAHSSRDCSLVSAEDATEQLGLVRDENRLKLDRWVLQSTLESLRLGQDQRLAERMVVIAPGTISYADETYRETVSEQLADEQSIATSLCFVFDVQQLRESPLILSFIHQLDAFGCKLAISASSVQEPTTESLKDIPADYLYLDPRAVRLAQRSGQEDRTLMSVTDAARQLGLGLLGQIPAEHDDRGHQVDLDATMPPDPDLQSGTA